MAFRVVSIKEFCAKPIDLWKNQWFLLTAGDFSTKKFNTMTVAWGSIGTMWDKPFVQVVVRPTRYTFEFIEAFDSFTLCAFPSQYRRVLNRLGSISGRNVDKIKESGLVPIPSQEIDAPGFQEASLILECRKIYWDDFEPGHFLDPRIEKNYPLKDYHRIYFGEILVILQR